MKAIIMAGGKGTRLMPYSALLPKPLMPLGDMPILELLLRRLKKAGIDDVFLAVGHLRHLIEAYFGDGARLGLRITYSHEETPLGTAGPMAAVLDRLGDDFVLGNGDLLTNMNMRAMIEMHRERAAAATVGVYEREVKIDFGLVDVDAAGRLIGYREKPSFGHLVSMGVYVLNRAAVAPHLARGRHLDMPELLQQMIAQAQNVVCYRENCFWLDIGRPDDFALAQEMFAKDRRLFLDE